MRFMIRVAIRGTTTLSIKGSIRATARVTIRYYKGDDKGYH